MRTEISRRVKGKLRTIKLYDDNGGYLGIIGLSGTENLIYIIPNTRLEIQVGADGGFTTVFSPPDESEPL